MITDKVTRALIASFTILLALPAARADRGPGDVAGGQSQTISDKDAGWSWSGMVPYRDSGSSAAGHAGGPGAYGVYTFTGQAVEVYGMRCPKVTVDQKSHHTGKVKISIDGKPQDTVDLFAPAVEDNSKIIGVSDLSDGNHVLQVDPVDGWAVIEGLKIVPSTGTGHPASDKYLVGYWPLSDNKGAIAADKSGHGHDGTLTAGAAWTSLGRAGGAAVAFPAPGGVEISGPIIDTARSFTVVAWVQLADVNGYQTVVSIDGQSVSGFYLQLRDDSHRFAFTMHNTDASDNNPTNMNVATASFTPQPGEWYQLVGVHNEGTQTIALYVDGAPQETAPFSTSWSASGNTVIGRGMWNGSYIDFVRGSVQDVRLYNKALSPAAIAQLYTAGRS